MKIVYNTCYGGFSLSSIALTQYAKLKGIGHDDLHEGRNLDRNDPILVQVVEELQERANGAHAMLAITDIPTGKQWRIDEYDGVESVMTPEDYDWQIAS